MLDQLPAPTRQLPSVLDSTMLTLFRSCPKKFYWLHILGLAGGEISIDLHAGGAFAKAREVMYRAAFLEKLSESDAVSKAEFAFHKVWGDTPDPTDPKNPKTRSNVWNALAAPASWSTSYLVKYGLHNDLIEPYTASGRDPFEFSFALPLDLETTGLDFPPNPVTGQPFIYAGRFDMLGKIRETDIILPLDDKTGKSIDKNWTAKWSFRGQFLGYVWAMNRLGIDCSHIAVRGTAIQKTQTNQAETIKPIPRHLIPIWLNQTWTDVNNLVSAWEHDYWPVNMGDHCTTYGMCDMMDLCIAKRPEDYFSSFPQRRWNPLHGEE